MKVLIVVAVLGFASAVLAHHTLTDEQKAKIKEIKTACIGESGASEEIVKKAKHDGVFEDEEKLGKFFACFAKKTEFMNDAGEFQVETIRKKMTEFYDADVAEKIIKECTHDKKGSVEETALHFAKCCHEHKPKHHH